MTIWHFLIGGGTLFGFVLFAGFVVMSQFYRKVEQGTALVRNGRGGTQVSFTGKLVIPILHIIEYMDLSVKRIEIKRSGAEGLICRDNMRADVEVAFFVRVNKKESDVMRVAESLGCERASDQEALILLFDAKFSEALKTVGKQFNFVDLYTNRETFKEQILAVIGTDLNGYALEDAAIDYLEQTPLEKLNADNILDAEGIKKIVELTSQQAILANDIACEKEKTITKQNVERTETVLELKKQQAEAEQKQIREISEITSREEASAKRVQAEERLKSEKARIQTDEEVAVAEENKQRQVIVAMRNKERTDKVEIERIEKDRALEQTERERVVTLAQIERDKAVEIEKKNIQEVIRERVMVQREVVDAEQKILDTEAFCGADREKTVSLTKASEEAGVDKVKMVVAAEANKESAREAAEQVVIEAEARRSASEKEAAARKFIADAKAQEEAVIGLSEARTMEAKAISTEKYGQAEANVIEAKAVAEAKGIAANADAIEKHGTAEAAVMHKKFTAEADGIKEKAEAMKIFNDAGKDHEEFKLQLNKDKEIQLAAINVERDIAEDRARIVGEAVKSAHIDIVGGESVFFDKIVGAITQGKSVDRTIDNSNALTTVKNTFFSGDSKQFKAALKSFVSQFGVSSEDLKNLTVSALLGKLIAKSDGDTQDTLKNLLDAAKASGVADTVANTLIK